MVLDTARKVETIVNVAPRVTADISATRGQFPMVASQVTTIAGEVPAMVEKIDAIYDDMLPELLKRTDVRYDGMLKQLWLTKTTDERSSFNAVTNPWRVLLL